MLDQPYISDQSSPVIVESHVSTARVDLGFGNEGFFHTTHCVLITSLAGGGLRWVKRLQEEGTVEPIMSYQAKATSVHICSDSYLRDLVTTARY